MSDIKVTLRNVRLSFDHLWEPHLPKGSAPGKKPKYGANFLLHKVRNASDVALVSATITKLIGLEKWRPETVKSTCLEEAHKKTTADGEPIAGYDKDHLYISAKNDRRPPVWDLDSTPLTAQDGRPYAGCFVNTTLDIYVSDRPDGRRICAQLRAVQFKADGDPFGAGSTPTDAAAEFGDVTADDKSLL